MKILNKSINVVAAFNTQGEIRPIKFKLLEEDEERVIIIDRLIDRRIEKVAAATYVTFICQSVICNTEKVYELRYNKKDMNWQLYKF